jgi:hypothetical protein
MANDPKSTGRALAPQKAGGDLESDLDTATHLAGVQGKVRQAIVQKLRKLVDKDPAAFVRGMRTWINEGRTDID